MEEITDQLNMYQLLTVFDSVFSPSLSEDSIDLKQYAEKLINDAVTYVAKEDNEVAGFITFYASDEKLEHSFITLLAVLPKYQGRKTAQALINQCVQTTITMGKKEIKLE
ncbi:GNAT family N-acetyltransferase, partial [Alkalibacterium sp. 20]|uniref:GNAT family N-acetyltransferase n=1 Tax=Alkalibacterium sp. 20 TaxID=1798803 RepID=UPI000A5D74C9